MKVDKKKGNALGNNETINVKTSCVITFLILYALNKNYGMYIGELSPKYIIKELKLGNPNKILIGHLNINSVRYKVECLKDIINNNIDILFISGTKLDDTFPVGQFLINEFYSPVRKDRNGKGGGLLLFIKEHIPFREIMFDPTPNIEVIFVEIKLRKQKWLLICSYNPDKKMIQNYLSYIGDRLDELSLKYENIILMADLNSEMCEEATNIFCNTNNFKCLVKKPTCF